MNISKDSFSVQLYSHQYREKVLKLLQKLWHNVNPENYDAYFRWKYEDNPYTRFPLIIICIAGEEVVGALGHMIQSIMVGGARHSICVPVDGIVHQDYRMYGIYSRMLKEGYKQIQMLGNAYDLKFFFNASSNAASAPGLVKSGWNALSPRSFYNKFSLGNILMRRKAKFLPKNVAFEFLCERSTCKLDITPELRMRDIETILAARADKIFMVHDLKYFSWKYSYNNDNYRYVYLYKAQLPVAYMVLNCGSSFQSSIEEYGSTDPSSLSLLITKTSKLLSLRILRLFIATISQDEKKTLNRAGLFEESKLLLKVFKKKTRTPVYIKNIHGDGSDSDYSVNGVNCLDGNNWRLFHADIL